MTGGWVLRGLHHFGAQAFVVVLVLHLLQMVIYGLYRAPREVNFWLVLALLPLAIAMSATGCLIGTPASIIANVPEHAVAIDWLMATCC